MMSLLTQALKDRSGSVNILAALSLPILIGFSAFAVDMGAVYLDETALQGATDLAALSAASRLDMADRTVRGVLDANGFADAEFRVQLGRYEADPAKPRDARFHVTDIDPNAVRVVANDRSPIYLARLYRDSDIAIEAQAIAAIKATASFSLASRLASLKGGIANALLKSLIGGEIELSAMDATALAGARIDAGSLAFALKGASAGAGEAKTLFEKRLPLADFVAALADASRQRGQLTAASLLERMARRTALRTVSVRPSDLISFDGTNASVAYPGRALGLDLDVLDILSAAVAEASGRSSIELEVGLGGVATAKIELLLGDPVQTTAPNVVGSPGAQASTAQLRARILVEIGGSGLIAGTEIRLPIEIVAASGKAELADIACARDPDARSASLAVTPGLFKVEIGEWSGPIESASIEPLRRPATIISARLAEVRGAARVSMADERPRSVVFHAADVRAGTLKNVRTREFVRSVAGDLLHDLRLDVPVLGMPLVSTRALPELLGAQLQPLAAPLDELIGALLGIGGIGLGEADVRMNAIDCGAATIVG